MRVEALNNLIREEKKDVSQILKVIQEKALSGHKAILVDQSWLNIYRHNKLTELGYVLEDEDDGRVKISGWGL